MTQKFNNSKEKQTNLLLQVWILPTPAQRLTKLSNKNIPKNIGTMTKPTDGI